MTVWENESLHEKTNHGGESTNALLQRERKGKGLTPAALRLSELISFARSSLFASLSPVVLVPQLLWWSFATGYMLIRVLLFDIMGKVMAGKRKKKKKEWREQAAAQGQVSLSCSMYMYNDFVLSYSFFFHFGEVHLHRRSLPGV